MSYDNNMQVIVSKVVSENTKAPVLRVQVQMNGEKYTAGLWPWSRKDGSQVRDKKGNIQYIGTLEVDTYQKEEHPTPPEPDFNDEIPFS